MRREVYDGVADVSAVAIINSVRIAASRVVITLTAPHYGPLSLLAQGLYEASMKVLETLNPNPKPEERLPST